MFGTDVNKSNFRNIKRNKLAKYAVNYVYAKINNLKQHLHRMALLQNNVRRI
jgi:hypothetical protein